MEVLVTGGAGFIGSTVCSALADAGHVPLALDNFVTGRREFTVGRTTYEGDLADGALIARIFAEHPGIAAVVHCAALVVVPDSVRRPLAYYRENVGGTVALLEHLLRVGCHRVVFSSSASIYRPTAEGRVDESAPLDPLSPYARTKAVVEAVLADVAAATPLRVCSLRYFNPIGADPQLRSGMQVRHPSHALGQLIAAHRERRPFTVTGTDYPTRDGSGLRDYVHVWDLARAHVAAVERFDDLVAERPAQVINLGTGRGITVLELAAAFNAVVDSPVAVRTTGRRQGDSAGAYAVAERAAELLGWRAELGLEQGVRDTLAWFDRRETVLFGRAATAELQDLSST